jgi:hypothetical protein
MIALALAGSLAVAGCQSGTGAGGGNTPPPTATTTTESAAGSTRPECANVLSAGQTLAVTATQFISGRATRDQLTAAAAAIGGAIDAARAVAGAEAGARLDDAKAAGQRLLDVATTQPPDFGAMRTAANDVVTVLRAAATACQKVTSTAVTTS